jgi:NADPH:quinone reductase-like Zn-dependent oxidoreductase
MKAVLFDEYGTPDTLYIGDIDKPTIGADEVLVKVKACAVNPKDVFIRRGRFRLFNPGFPKQTGFDFAGTVAERGVNVHHVQVGDAVFGHLDGFRGGTAAEYVKVNRTKVAHKPESLSIKEAAAVSLVSQTALQALRDEGHIESGMRVCINGASGGVGSMAVQIAAHYDTHITAISSEGNHDFCRDLGADTTVDYRTTDITRSDERFDIFFDVFGNHRYENIRPILTANGTYITTVPGPGIFMRQLWTGLTSSQKAKLVVVESRTSDLNLLSDWFNTGVLRPVIDSVFTLETIAEAHARQQTKHARGKIVVTVDDNLPEVD